MTEDGNPGSKSRWKEPDDHFFTGREQCKGCGSLVATKSVLRAIYESAPNAMVFGRSCGAGRSELQTGGRIGVDGSGLMGIQAAMEVKGVLDDRLLVVLTGEGRALEMGAGDFLASFDREQRLTWIILDNQAYANSGSAATAMTPLKASTRIHTRPDGGKHTGARDMPLMMIHSQARYVATATPAYMDDLVGKVKKALSNQPSYLHIYVPCQVSWQHSPEQVVQISRRMVRSGMVSLWEFEDEVFKRTVRRSRRSREDFEEYLNLQGRYRGLCEEDIADLEEAIEKRNRRLDALELAFSKQGIGAE